MGHGHETRRDAWKETESRYDDVSSITLRILSENEKL
jgi:hypothetical protein